MEKRPCLPLRYVCNIVVIPLQEDNRPSQPTTSSFSSCTLQGVRRVCAASDGGQHGFQSTHSLRSATDMYSTVETYRDVSIHALLAECDVWARLKEFYAPVSIHALLAECDCSRSCYKSKTRSFNPRTPCGVRRRVWPGKTRRPRFQSTHSLRSATVLCRYRFFSCSVSIHALLAECDNSLYRVRPPLNGFNPRTPCGVRPPARPS